MVGILILCFNKVVVASAINLQYLTHWNVIEKSNIMVECEI